MIVALILLAAVLVLLALTTAKPRTIDIRRSVEIQAAPERIFALLDDFHHWKDWAPQDRMDATMQRSFGGPASGLGAYSEWTAKGQAGCGRMEIVACEAPHRLLVQVDFAKPFKARNRNEFTLQASGGSTRLSWTMQGPRPFPARVMSVFIDLERMMGKHFESGLQSLKTLAEQARTP